jgi:UDP-glucose 4-epimerase
MRVLLTGGLGFIGSHSAVVLGQYDHEIIILDNLSNSSIKVLSKINHLVKDPSKIHFVEGDVLDTIMVNTVFERFGHIDAVIHFASLKSVNESIEYPLVYYRKNMDGLLTILEVMQKHKCNKFIFSSSSTVYGCDTTAPIQETDRIGLSITNPYGQTKYFQEQILTDYKKAHPEFGITILRYFNPAGAHPSGLLGEDPRGIPNNLFPYILRVATCKLDYLTIYGNDYDTHDGTCIRDYIHVMDLAEGHIAALDHIKQGLEIYNLGTGKGTSVLEFVKTFERINNVHVPYKIGMRRDGDVPVVYADVCKVHKAFGWKTTRTVEDICRDGYHFQNR